MQLSSHIKQIQTTPQTRFNTRVKATTHNANLTFIVYTKYYSTQQKKAAL